MSLSKPTALIFDWDNTLVDTWPIIHAALNQTFREMGKREWTIEETREKVRKSMRDSFPEVFGDSWEEAGKRYQQHYRSSHLEKLTPLPDAHALLAHIAALGIPSFVVSNKKGVPLRLEVEHLGWSPYFKAVVGSDDAARDKPHADPVEFALKDSGIRPGADVWFIGDSEIDLETAQVVGCLPILFGEHAREHASYTPTGYHGFAYHTHVLTLKELADFLKF